MLAADAAPIIPVDMLDDVWPTGRSDGGMSCRQPAERADHRFL